jgi:hypothetical protein
VAAFKHKTQEEYYAEVITLKKALGAHQSAEAIAKAKLEYLATELAKKEQEVLGLLDVRREAVAGGGGGGVGGELEAVNLRIRAYKLEMVVRRKEAELQRLRTDVKGADVRELRVENERLRVELSKALMNEARVLAAKEVDVGREAAAEGSPGGKVLVKQVGSNWIYTGNS